VKVAIETAGDSYANVDPQVQKDMRRKKKVYELFSTANLKELCKKFDVPVSCLVCTCLRL
jgi:hypothetical protein